MLKWMPLALAIAGSPLTVLAQPTAAVPAVEAPRGHTGTLVRYSDTDVTLQEKDGLAVVPMTPGWTVVTARSIGLGEVKAGDFVASINADLGPETGRANELRLFEPGYRPEVGTHAMPQPNTSITHGIVQSVRSVPSGVELDVVYPQGRRLIQAPVDMKATTYDLHERGFARPGATVSVVTRRGEDGVWRAGRIVVQE